ncbi:MAG: hypothetical protein IPP77_05815 [Bacteroidetes bacterium]|nr:hypothetical protein [Bacteroidota bacterium]
MKTVLHLGVITLLSLIFSNSFSQTLLNQRWALTSSIANQADYHILNYVDQEDNTIVITSDYSTLLGDNIAIRKYDSEGGALGNHA